MTIFQWLAGSALALLCAAAVFVWWPRWRRRRMLRQPFPAAWQAHLAELPWYARLPAALREELQRLVRVFLHEKQFVGCEGLEVSDRMRVIVAAQACLLLLNRPHRGYRDLRWVYLFPGEFRALQPEYDEAGVVSHRRGSLLGVSWENGRVVLAWDSVLQDLADASDGRNVVLHEFAHQLDQEDGAADGAPLLYTREGYRDWSAVLGHEYHRLQAQLARGRESLIDPYGASDPAEFFAVVTELFYERPAAMSSAYPKLFEVLHGYYRVDPRDWRCDARGPSLEGEGTGWPGTCRTPPLRPPVADLDTLD
ncbi:zinc-dependent peptidase [Mangrovimicrobium sediminis]|uniref:Zinc-dependent peptidase n=1 Tax=Mangrovimicrobium sediminis TaxID=2562682 RepID=A0A4Z0M8I5_9GAMM|nr:M90 family metallopeptidase [Haliea sp. SAOS-164]TGD75710.1 zinc-dependent peptidase [Haliea sp. SAOS-164]